MGLKRLANKQGLLVTRMEVPRCEPGLTEQVQENREIGGCLPLQTADELPFLQHEK